MKRVLQTAVILLFLLTLCACNLSEEELREKAIDQLNQNSDLPFPLALPENELGDISAYQRIDGYGCWGLEDADATITISGYPDCLDAYHVTDIRFRTTRYSVFGVRIGDIAKDAVERLKSEGYVRVPDTSDLAYTKDGVVIRLEYSDTEGRQLTVSVLTVYLLTTNVEDVNF